MTDPAGEPQPKGEYQVEYAKSGRAQCQGCKELIAKDELRLGVLIDSAMFQGWTKWRHWGCVTNRVVQNMVGPQYLKGLEELMEEDQVLIMDTFDKPPAPKPRKGSKPKKQKAEAEAVDGEAEAAAEAKPARKPRAKRAKRGAAAPAAAVASPAAAGGAAAAAPSSRDVLLSEISATLGGALAPELMQYFAGPMAEIALVQQLQELGMLHSAAAQQAGAQAEQPAGAMAAAVKPEPEGDVAVKTEPDVAVKTEPDVAVKAEPEAEAEAAAPVRRTRAPRKAARKAKPAEAAEEEEEEGEEEEPPAHGSRQRQRKISPLAAAAGPVAGKKKAAPKRKKHAAEDTGGDDWQPRQTRRSTRLAASADA